MSTQAITVPLFRKNAILIIQFICKSSRSYVRRIILVNEKEQKNFENNNLLKFLALFMKNLYQIISRCDSGRNRCVGEQLEHVCSVPLAIYLFLFLSFSLSRSLFLYVSLFAERVTRRMSVFFSLSLSRSYKEFTNLRRSCKCARGCPRTRQESILIANEIRQRCKIQKKQTICFIVQNLPAFTIIIALRLNLFALPQAKFM